MIGKSESTIQKEDNVEKSIRQILKDFEANPNGDFSDLFYDWFCDKKHLKAKAQKLLKKLRMLVPSTKFGIDNTTVTFKNNCPGSGSLYDSMMISEIGALGGLFTIVPKTEHTSAEATAEVYDCTNDCYVAGIVTWNDVKKFFNAI